MSYPNSSFSNSPTDRDVSEQVGEWHPDCHAAEIRYLAWEQRLDDRSSVTHASDGRTATIRVGSTWTQSLPSSGGLESQNLWPEPSEDQRELSEAVDKFLDQLKPEEVELLLLRFQHRIPLRAIGDLTGCSKDTVQRSINELLRKLKQELSSQTGASTYSEVRTALMRKEEAA